MMFELQFVWFSWKIHDHVSKRLGFWMRCPTCGLHWGKHGSECSRVAKPEIDDKELLIVLRCFYRSTDLILPRIVVKALEDNCRRKCGRCGITEIINGGILYPIFPHHVGLTQYSRAIWKDAKNEGLLPDDGVDV